MNTITLNQPNTTSTATVLILEAVTDLVGKDPTKPYALTKVITRDKVQHRFNNFDNRPLGKVGEVIDIVVQTQSNQRDDSDEYYASASTVPAGFFQD